MVRVSKSKPADWHSQYQSWDLSLNHARKLALCATYGGAGDGTVHLPQEVSKSNRVKNRQKKERKKPHSDGCEAEACTRENFR